MKSLAVLLFLAAIAPPGTTPQVPPKPPGQTERRAPGFTWWNDAAALVQEGNRLYGEESFGTAGDTYRDAQVMRPDEAAVPLNLGLARAQEGNLEAAVRHFEDALDLAGDDPALREQALYNLGVTRWNQAVEAVDPKTNKPDEKRMIESAVKSLDAFDGALALNPENEDALKNKREVQHLLQELSRPPEQRQQQQQQGGQDGDQQQQQQQNQQDQQQGDQQQQQQQNQQQQGNQQQQQGNQQQQDQSQQQDQQQQGDQQQQQNQQQGDGDQQQQQQQPQAGEEEQEQQDQQQAGEQQESREMSEEEARALLNLLNDEKSIVLRKNASRLNRPEPEKDW